MPRHPGGPSEQVGDWVDTTGGNVDYAGQLQIDAENDLGSVIGSLGGSSYYSAMFFPTSNTPCGSGTECALGWGIGFGGGGGNAIGSIIAPVGAIGTSIGLGKIIEGLLQNGIGGSNSGSGNSGAADNSGAAAQPPNDEDPDDLGPRWKPQDIKDKKCWTGCEKKAREIKKKLRGGDIFEVSNSQNPAGGRGNECGLGPNRDQQPWVVYASSRGEEWSCVRRIFRTVRNVDA